MSTYKIFEVIYINVIYVKMKLNFGPNKCTNKYNIGTVSL